MSWRKSIAFCLLFVAGLTVGIWVGMFGPNGWLVFGVAVAANVVAYLLLPNHAPDRSLP